ncbi:MAG: MCP four helix bundle domain-containing protein, partial [Burkholderiaceae bacterium]|nr:MCP four helix bundle domain-containing protein [Burkholderiaceae bacterium]
MSAMLRQFSIRTRMIGAIAMVLALLLMVGGVGLFGMRSMHNQSQQFKEKTIQSSHQMASLVLSVGNLRRFEKDILIAYQTPEKVPEPLQRWEAALQQFNKTLAEMAAVQVEANASTLKEMKSLVDSYAAKVQPVFKQVGSGQVANVSVADQGIESAKVDIRKAQQLVDELGKQLDLATNKSLAEAQQTEDRVLLTFMAILALSALVVTPLTLLNMQS